MKKEYKDLFNDITPGEELENKVLNNTKTKKRILFTPKKFIAAAAVFIFIIAGSFGIYRVSSVSITQQDNNTNAVESKDFTVIAYAQDSKDDIKTISNEDIGLMNLKISLNESNDGYSVSASSDDNGLTVRSDDDIESVTFESENGTFTYIDSLLKNYLIKQKKFYSAVIPIKEQQYNEFSKKIAESNGEETSDIKQKLVSEIINGKDCTDYIYDDDFDVSKISTYEYSCYLSDMPGEDENYYDYCILIIDKEKNQGILQSNRNTVVAKTYQPGDEIGYVNYWPDGAVEYLLNNPNTSFSELPTDVITITVKFKTGQTVSKEIVTSFDSDGMLKMKIK